MNWSEFIEFLVREYRLSEPELASISGMTYPTINRIRRGVTKKPNQSTIKRLEEGLKIKIEDRDPENITYQKLDNPKLPENKFEGALPVYVYPVLSTVYAGEPEMLYVEHHDDTASFIYNKKDHRCFAVRVSGKSMETTLKDGDIALVDMDLLPEDGDLVAVKLKNGHQYIKRYKNLNYAFIQLSSDNGDYGTRVIDKNDIDAIFPVIAVHMYLRK